MDDHVKTDCSHAPRGGGERTNQPVRLLSGGKAFIRVDPPKIRNPQRGSILKEIFKKKRWNATVSDGLPRINRQTIQALCVRVINNCSPDREAVVRECLHGCGGAGGGDLFTPCPAVPEPVISICP